MDKGALTIYKIVIIEWREMSSGSLQTSAPKYVFFYPSALPDFIYFAITNFFVALLVPSTIARAAANRSGKNASVVLLTPEFTNLMGLFTTALLRIKMVGVAGVGRTGAEFIVDYAFYINLNHQSLKQEKI